MRRVAIVAAAELRALARGDTVVVRAGWWAWRAGRTVHRQLALRGPNGVVVPTAPVVDRTRAGRAGTAVGAALALSRRTCLEQALVRQSWAAAAGDRTDVVVGVTAPGGGFRAHAWLDGERVDPRFVELWRVPAPARGAARQPRGA